MKRSKLLRLLLVAVGIMTLWPVMPVRAANGVTLAPAIKDVVLEEKQASAEFTFTLTNNSSQSLTLRLSTLDFGSLDESGGVTFISKSSDGFATKYGLKEWIRLSTDSVVLAPGEKKEARAIIDNKESLAPGGHYGAVVATPIDSEMPDDENIVAISPSLSVLVFLKKQGGENYSLGLQEPTLSRALWKLPNSVNLRFQNSGNVHVVPRGTLTVLDGDTQIAKGIINQDSATILPESFRNFRTDLTRTGRSWLVGKYTLKAEWRYDGSDEVQETVVEFYYLGNILYLVLGIFCIVLICFVVLKAIRRK